MKLLLDMNIPLKYSTLLEKKGVEYLRWSDVGSPNAPDEEIMAYARDNDLVVLTYDLDFSTILSTTQELKPSVVQIRISLMNADRAVDLIASAIRQNTVELGKGAILSIDLNRARLRLLPL